MNTVVVDSLGFSYGNDRILDKVSFALKKGEFVAIFGPNGGGKTTLLKLLMGFLKPTKGTISLFGHPVQRGLRKVGWVPQNFHFDAHFPISVEEVVLGGRLFNLRWNGRFGIADYKAAKEALEVVHMEAFLKAPFSALSGGQAQRVLIARALASAPELLLLDEPTANVDFETQREIYKTLATMKSEMTILMVTHDLKEALESVDRLLCVQKTVIEFTPEAVCEHFALGLYHPPLKKETL